MCSSLWRHKISSITILMLCFVVVQVCARCHGVPGQYCVDAMLCSQVCAHCYWGTRQLVLLHGCCVVVQVRVYVFIAMEALDNQSHCRDVVLLCRYVFLCSFL